MGQVQITVPGIKKALSQYNYCQAIAEYIWNGFDARATSVELHYKANEIGHISEKSCQMLWKFLPASFLVNPLPLPVQASFLAAEFRL